MKTLVDIVGVKSADLKDKLFFQFFAALKIKLSAVQYRDLVVIDGI